MTRSSIILSARRSPIAPRHGALAHLSIADLAAPVVQSAMEDAGVAPDNVSELIAANSLGAGGNPARIVALATGLPQRVAGLSIDRQCVGGLDALLLADAMIRSGHCDVVIAGGVESYSRQPLRSHTFADGRPPLPYTQAAFTPWPDRDPDMAEAANQLARALNISKAEQDKWACDSHAAALTASSNHLVPIAGTSTDSFTRKLTERLCNRAPAVTGDITTANMAVAADGAAFVVMASSDWASAHNKQGIAFISGCTVGDDPELPGLAPVAAIKHALNTADITTDEITAAEIMEAFAVQAIACQRGAAIPRAVTNTWGGALARGHPIGASGAVLAVQLFQRLSAEGGGVGVAAIAAAGGLGAAVIMRA